MFPQSQQHLPRKPLIELQNSAKRNVLRDSALVGNAAVFQPIAGAMGQC